MSMKRYPDAESAKDKNHPNLLYDLGYCNDVLKALSVFHGALEHDDLGKNYRTLCQLTRPCEPSADNPQEGDASCDAKAAVLCQNEEAEEDACPLNKKEDTKLCAEQKEVVENLHRRVEILQGPPGTGKSTLIRSIAREKNIGEAAA
jgi:hypothetical protein